MRIKATLLILFGLLAACHAQLKIHLQFDSASPKEVFVSPELPNSPPSNSTKVATASYDYQVPAFGPNDKLFVWDHATNNIASIPIKNVTKNAWSPLASDYTLIGDFTIHVEHDGQPVQAAKVTVATKGKTADQLLDPTSKGDVRFFCYPAGNLHVKVTYNTAQKQGLSQEQIFPVSSNRDHTEPVLAVAIADDVPTIQESAASAVPGATSGTTPKGDEKAASPTAPESGSPVTKLIVEALALLIIVGIGYWFFNLVKNKPKEFEQGLQKLGVQIPTQQDPDANASVQAQPLPPAPPAPKILLDDAEPVVLGSGSTAVAPPAPVGREPALVRETGERMTLREGEMFVGREDGLDLSLVGESTVSRKHASLTRTGNMTILKDLGSTNGTFLNGTRLQGEAVLKPGDQVQFGSVRFRYEG